MQFSKYLMFVAVVVMTFSGCALKPKSTSPVGRFLASSKNCNCLKCRFARAAEPMATSTDTDCGCTSGCSCAAAPIAYDSAQNVSPPVHAWPAISGEEKIAPLSTEPVEIEVAGEVDDGKSDDDFFESPPAAPFQSSEAPVEKDDDSDFVQAPEMSEPEEVVTEVVETEVVETEPVEVIKVASNDNNQAVILRARPTERHNFSKSYQTTPAAPVRQISNVRRSTPSTNGLRGTIEPLPVIKLENGPAPTSKVKAQQVSATKRSSESTYTAPQQDEKTLRLRAYSSNEGLGSTGRIDAKFRKVDTDANIRYGGSDDQDWYYESDSIDSSHKLNYYFPARTQSQRSADQRNAETIIVTSSRSDAKFDFERIESDFHQASGTPSATTELQTVER
jgi:hypothetical protein